MRLSSTLGGGVDARLDRGQLGEDQQRLAVPRGIHQDETRRGEPETHEGRRQSAGWMEISVCLFVSLSPSVFLSVSVFLSHKLSRANKKALARKFPLHNVIL